MRILYVIQKVGQDNLYVKVERGIPVVVTDINNVTELIKCKNYSEFIVKLVELL